MIDIDLIDNYIDPTPSPLEPELYIGSTVNDVKESRRLNSETDADLKHMGYRQPQEVGIRPDWSWKDPDGKSKSDTWFEQALERTERLSNAMDRQMLNVTHEIPNLPKPVKPPKPKRKPGAKAVLLQFSIISPEGVESIGSRTEMMKLFPGTAAYFWRCTEDPWLVTQGKAKNWVIRRLKEKSRR